MREEPGGVGRAGVRSAAFDGRRTATHDRTRNHAGGRHPLRGASREAPRRRGLADVATLWPLTATAIVSTP